MHILFLTDNFVPESNAPATRTFEHARRWCELGHQVTVVTGIPNFPTGRPLAPYRNRLFQREMIEGIEVRRVWTYLAPNEGVLRRSLDFLSFAFSGFFGGLRVPADVIVATSPQLLTGLAGKWLARLKRKPFVFEVRDLWPDSIIAVGVMRDNIEIRVLRRIESGLYRRADRVVTVSNALASRLIESGVPAAKLTVVSNGVDPKRFLPRSKDAGLLKSLGLEGKFVVGYVGSLGAAHGLETALDAAALLKSADAHFLFVGEGARYRELREQAKRMKLTNVHFTGLVSGENVPDYLAVCDLALVALRRADLFRAAIPSKMFEAAAMERPILLAVEGAAAELVERYEAGIVVPPGNAEAMAATITALRSNRETLELLKAGCRRMAKDYDRSRLAEKMLNDLLSVCAASESAD